MTRTRSRLLVEALEVRDNPSIDIDPLFSNGGQATAHFGSGNDSVQALAVQADGKIVLAGYAQVGGDVDFGVVRLNADGTRDTTFGTNGRASFDVAGSGQNDYAYAVTVDSAGRILVAGSAKRGTDYDFAVIRVTATGQLDSTFGSGGKFFYDFNGSTTATSNNDTAYGVAVLASGQIIVGGTARIGADDDFAAIRLTASGTRDTTFGVSGGRTTIDFGSGNDSAYGMAVRPNGKIVLSGTALVGSDRDFAIAQLNATGTVDTAFGNPSTPGRRSVDVSGRSGTTGGNDAAYTMTLLPTGASVLVGKARIGPDDDFAILQFTTAGALDTTFGGGDGIATTDFAGTDNSDPNNLANDAAFGVATDPSGGFVVVGRARVGADFDYAAVRYTAAGVVDTDFGTNGKATYDFDTGNDCAFAVTVQPNGQTVIAGEGYIGGDLDFAAVRLESVTAPPADDPNAGLANQDSDGDGLLDSWETRGIDYNGDGVIDLNLPAMGANPRHRDLFVEIDAMRGRAPSSQAVQMVVNSFANAPNLNLDGRSGVTLHVVVDETNLPLVDWTPSTTSRVLPDQFYTTGLAHFGSAADRASRNSFNILQARALVFRYGIFANKFDAPGHSGIAEIGGQNFVVALGNFGPPAGGTVDQQAGTFMHEFGHTLGLRHYGSTDQKAGFPQGFSDDYPSIMNYRYQFGETLLPPNTDAGHTHQRLARFPDYDRNGVHNRDWNKLRYNFRTGVGSNLGLDASHPVPDEPEQIIAPAPPVVPGSVVVGGGDGTARVFSPTSGGQFGPAATVAPFPGFAGQVRTAAGDVNGDGVTDTVFATGPGTPLRLAVISGADNTTVLVAPFDPFGGDFTGGGYVAAADLDGDGRAEFVVTPDEGGGPRVTVFSLNADGSRTVRANFFGIDDANFRGARRAALGDVNGDGTPDVIVSAGFGGGPRTAIFTGQSVLTGSPGRLVGDFFAFPGSDATTLRNGSFVAAGDIDGDGYADLVFGGGPGGAPRVFALSGRLIAGGDVGGSQAAPLANFFVAGNVADRGGVRVTVKDTDGDGLADVGVGSGAGSASRVRVYLGANFNGAEPGGAIDLDPFGGAVLPGGVFVG